MTARLYLIMAIALIPCMNVQGGNFELSPGTEIPIIGAAALTAAGSLFLNGNPGAQRDRSEINGLDSLFMAPYSRTLDTAGTAGAVLSLAAPGSLILFSRFAPNELLTYGTMYAEAFLLTYGVKNLMKDLVSRWRPRTYFSKPDDSDNDFFNSFPSGHTMLAFMGASFFSTVLLTDYGKSRLSLPLSLGSLAAALTTGILRVASGEHFATDVLAGAAIGSFIGWLIPAIHKKGPAENQSISLQVPMNGISIRFSF